MNKYSNTSNICSYETIADVLNHPFIHRELRLYYEYNNPGESATFKKRGTLTPLFYEFIRDVFGSYSEMKGFLRRIRASYQENRSQISEISPCEITNALLVFEELHQHLSLGGTQCLKVSNICKKNIYEIVQIAYIAEVELDAEEHQNVSVNTSNSLYKGLKNAVRVGCALSEDGEIVYLKGIVKKGVFDVVELGSCKELQVNKYGTVIPKHEKPNLRIVETSLHISGEKKDKPKVETPPPRLIVLN